MRFARSNAGQHVLDVGCGTGVAAITAARLGAKVTGVDLTPELMERAKDNANIAGTALELVIGDMSVVSGLARVAIPGNYYDFFDRAYWLAEYCRRT